MKRIAFICLALALLSGCSKEKIVSTSCTFDLKIDWVKGTKVQFTVTPGNPDACYCYGVMSADQPQAAWSDTELVEWQLGWITDIYNSLKGTGEAGSFADMFCYKGPRTIKQTKLSSGVDFVLLVFQINPQTKEAIGPLYRLPFSTLPVTKEDLFFTIHPEENGFTIIPSDPERTWFWDFETDEKIRDVFSDAYFFYYSVLDLYEEYDFLENLLYKGPSGLTLPAITSDLPDGVQYTLAMSGCAGGEINSDVYYAKFTIKSGKITFTDSDVPIQ